MENNQSNINDAASSVPFNDHKNDTSKEQPRRQPHRNFQQSQRHHPINNNSQNKVPPSQNRESQASPPLEADASQTSQLKQTNQNDRYLRPSLSQHGASPRRTFFSSDELSSRRKHPPRQNNKPQQNRSHVVGPNPRLMNGQPPAPGYTKPKQPVPAHQTQSQPARETTKPDTAPKRITRRRFGGKDSKYAVVGEIQEQARTNQPTQVVLSSGSRKLRIIPMGGAGEAGSKNMTVFEYGDDIVVIDCGIAFADRDLPGVDSVIPDVTYLEERKANIRGMVFTHGHEDHIGSVPFIWPKLSCPMYASPLTAGLINHKLEESGLTQASVTVINPGDTLHFGKISIEAVRLTHSIPDVLGLALRCPDGLFFYATDWRIEHTPELGQPADWTRIAQLAGEGITALFSDSTNVDRPGYSPSEKIVGKAFDEIFQNTKGRIILAQFSSQINRIQQVINSAKRYSRKIALSGRSMETYVNVAMNLGYLKVPEGMLMDLRKINTLPPEKVAILSTGSQGEEFSSLTRMSEGEHKHVKLDKNDTVVIAASAVPGNEISVARMIDNIYREGANVIYNKTMDVHVSGHPSREELKFMIAICKPKYFIPIHGDYRMIVEHGKVAVEMGVDPNNIMIVENGQVIEFDEKGGRLTGDKVQAGDVLIDGLGVGDVGPIVIRDRLAMAKEGIVTIFLVVRQKTGEMVTSPDIISRGFIYMREAEDLMQKIRNEIKNSYTKSQQRLGTNYEEIKQAMRDEISEFINKNTGRNPMVIPVIATI